MIQMLRKEACSGSIDDLAHVRSEDCMADCLTKNSAKSDPLKKALKTGYLPNVDANPEFRTLLKNKHKAYLAYWVYNHLERPTNVLTFLCEPIHTEIVALCCGALRLPGIKDI